MIKKIIFLVFLALSFTPLFCQNSNHKKTIGFYHGFGNEIKNRNYSYSNNYYKIQLGYALKETQNFKYELVLQPELNFATHQLLNLYFVTPEESNYLEKREKYTKLKSINEYALGVGLCIRKPWSKSISTYFLASIGPMIIDADTERLSKGFAFSDVLAIGFSYQVNKVSVDIKPSIRHVSNAGLGKTNSGYNTSNIELGLFFPL